MHLRGDGAGLEHAPERVDDAMMNDTDALGVELGHLAGGEPPFETWLARTAAASL
jgi:hypothetical protein